MDTIVEFVKLAFVGTIAGLFSSFLSNWSFRHKKWWELRVDAYQAAIESLSDLVYYYGVHSNTWDSGGIGTDQQEKLRETIDVAIPKIRKMADSGSFLFSDEANIVLRNFVDFDVGEITDPGDYYGPIHAEASECLKKLISLSKKILKF